MGLKQTKGSTRSPMPHDSCFGKGYADGGLVEKLPASKNVEDRRGQWPAASTPIARTASEARRVMSATQDVPAAKRAFEMGRDLQAENSSLARDAGAYDIGKKR